MPYVRMPMPFALASREARIVRDQRRRWGLVVVLEPDELELDAIQSEVIEPCTFDTSAQRYGDVSLEDPFLPDIDFGR